MAKKKKHGLSKRTKQVGLAALLGLTGGIGAASVNHILHNRYGADRIPIDQGWEMVDDVPLTQRGGNFFTQLFDPKTYTSNLAIAAKAPTAISNSALNGITTAGNAINNYMYNPQQPPHISYGQGLTSTTNEFLPGVINPNFSHGTEQTTIPVELIQPAY